MIGVNLVRTSVIALAMIYLPTPAMSATSATVAPYYPTYNVTTPYQIDSIVLADYKTGENSLTNSFSVFPPNYTIQNPFAQTQATISTFFLGTSFLANDSTEHLVLALNNNFGASLIGRNFSDVFTGFTEADIIAAADTLARPNTETAVNAAVSKLFAFSDFVIYSAGGGFALGDSFTLTSFSTGQPAGTGQSVATPAPVAAVPEMSSWAMMVFGLGIAGATMRTRARKQADRPAIC